jgi:hypothetical protein
MNKNISVNGADEIECDILYADEIYLNGSKLNADDGNNNFQTQINNIVSVNNTQQTQINNIVSSNTNLQNQINDVSDDLNIVKGEYLRYLGNWSDVEPRSFMKNDIVRYNGSAWVMSVDNYTDDVNPEDSDEWKILCEKGEKGDRGSDGDSGLDELLTALGVLTIGGILIPMTLATLLSRINAIPEIEGDIDDIQNDINDNDNRINELERITKYQDSLNNINRTIFDSDLFITDASGNNAITLNRTNGKMDALEIETNNININNNLYVAENQTIVGDSNLNNLNVNGNAVIGGGILNLKRIDLNGFIFVNGFPLNFGTNGFFQQF